MNDIEKLSVDWQNFCRRGKKKGRGVAVQAKSVVRCLNPNGTVTGYFSGLVPDPRLAHTHALYPSHEHLIHRDDHSEMVVETRLVNDMKSILSEKEFWEMIEHLYAVGVEKSKITDRKPKKLRKGWIPDRSFEKQSNYEIK